MTSHTGQRRRATVDDVPAIHRLINGFAAKGLMLPRSRYSVYEHLRDYIVAAEGADVIACVALHVVWQDLAEIRSLAVAEDHQQQGIARALVRAALADAGSLGVDKVFVLTYVPPLFARLGFEPVDKAELPQKIWHECVHCAEFPDCGEEALILPLDEGAGSSYWERSAPSV